MTEANRLAYLMKALKITVKELAEAIYIDLPCQQVACKIPSHFA